MVNSGKLPIRGFSKNIPLFGLIYNKTILGIPWPALKDIQERFRKHSGNITGAAPLASTNPSTGLSDSPAALAARSQL
jgi:hypothetical protein